MILWKLIQSLLCGYGRSRRAGRHFCPGNTPRERLSSFGYTNQLISFILYLFEIICVINFHSFSNEQTKLKLLM